MRIDDKAQTGLNKLDNTSAKKKTSAGSTGQTVSSSSDSVSLSDSAKDLASISSSLQNTPEVRADLVASLKSRIDSGQYDVSGRQVAEKIVQTAVDDLF